MIRAIITILVLLPLVLISKQTQEWTKEKREMRMNEISAFLVIHCLLYRSMHENPTQIPHLHQSLNWTVDVEERRSPPHPWLSLFWSFFSLSVFLLFSFRFLDRKRQMLRISSQRRRRRWRIKKDSFEHHVESHLASSSQGVIIIISLNGFSLDIIFYFTCSFHLMSLLSHCYLIATALVLLFCVGVSFGTS